MKTQNPIPLIRRSDSIGGFASAKNDVSNPDPPPSASRKQGGWCGMGAAGLAAVWLAAACQDVRAQAGMVDTNFVPDTEAIFGLEALTVAPDGSVVLATIESESGIGRLRILGLDARGARDPNFHSPQFVAAFIDGLAAQDDGRVLVSGYFDTVDGVARPGLARLQSDGSPDLSFDPGWGAPGSITAMVMQTNGQVVITGPFTSFNGVELNPTRPLRESTEFTDAAATGVGRRFYRAVPLR